jgi:hypothetical protein
VATAFATKMTKEIKVFNLANLKLETAILRAETPLTNEKNAQITTNRFAMGHEFCVNRIGGFVLIAFFPTDKAFILERCLLLFWEPKLKSRSLFESPIDKFGSQRIHLITQFLQTSSRRTLSLVLIPLCQESFEVNPHLWEIVMGYLRPEKKQIAFEVDK